MRLLALSNGSRKKVRAIYHNNIPSLSTEKRDKAQSSQKLERIKGIVLFNLTFSIYCFIEKYSQESAPMIPRHSTRQRFAFEISISPLRAHFRANAEWRCVYTASIFRLFFYYSLSFWFWHSHITQRKARRKRAEPQLPHEATSCEFP